MSIAITIAPPSDLVYHGPGIPPPATRHPDTSLPVQLFVRTLFHGEALSNDVFKTHTFKTILIEADPKLLNEFKLEIQHELDHLYQNPPLEGGEMLWNFNRWHLISFLSLSYPKNGESFFIPILQDGVVKRVEYVIDLITLHSPEETEPIHALGMTSKTDPTAPPIFTSLPTTLPGANNFLTTIFQDFTPNKSVGESIYEYNKETLKQWFTGKSNIIGAMISLSAGFGKEIFRDYEKQFDRMYAINAPWAHTDLDIGNISNLDILSHPKDFVSKVGKLPTGKKVTLYHIEAVEKEDDKEKHVSINMFNAHALVIPGFPEVKITRKNIDEENECPQRKVVSFLHRYLGPIFIYLPLIVALVAFRTLLLLGNIIVSYCQSIRQKL